MIVTTAKMLQDAKKGGYAIPAINTQGGNYDIIWAICQAAQEMASPIILAHYVSTGGFSGHDWFVNVAKWCANKVSVPVAIHLDHGEDFDICMHALNFGFTSIMFDGSKCSVEENAKKSNEIIKVSKSLGIPVETEIGELARVSPKGTPQPKTELINVEEIRRYLSLCTPDSLAIGIGNLHGFYTETPDIRIDILEDVRKFTDIPFVLHGCTGMNEDLIRQAISHGVAKINFGTQVRHQYIEHYQEGINTTDYHQGHPWKISQFAAEKLVSDIRSIIELSGSKNMA